MSSTLTRTGPRKLSDVARHVVAPRGIVATGWPAVEAKCMQMGITFRPWQPDVGRLILAKRADGKYAATIGGTGLSIPRQVGKTFLVGAIVFALCLLHRDLTVIWTAHRLRTADETFGKMQKFAKRGKIAPFIAKIVLGSGDEAVMFTNGSRILFGARERGFGRGFDAVDVLIFDEAQILSEGALDDMVPATNQSQQVTSALLLFMGTPPKPNDPSEVFTRMRREALVEVDGADTGWVEFGADTAYVPTALPAPLTEADWRQVAKANPSYPQDTPREAILRMRKQLGPESFIREGFGIWDEDDGNGALSTGTWAERSDPDAPRGTTVAFGVDVAQDRTAWVAVAWRRADGASQVMLADPEPSSAFSVVSRCVDLARQWGGQVFAPASLEPELAKAGVPTTAVKQTEFTTACGSFADAITEGRLRHGNQRALNDAVKDARWRSAGSTGERAFALKDSPQVGPLAAAVRALHGLSSPTDVALNVW